MAKEIIPHKLIITINEDWTIQSSLLSYRMKENGAMDAQKYMTMSVNAGVDAKKLSEIVTSAKSHTEKGEKIDEKK